MEPGDDEADNRYIRAERFLKNWQSEGVLFTEGRSGDLRLPAAVHLDGRTHIRRGFMARMRLSPFGEGQVFPHEQTHVGAQARPADAHGGHARRT